MSFQIQLTSVACLNCSQLFGPGSCPEIFDKMAKSAADVVNLDLEDYVALDDKEKAHSNVIEATNNIDWKNKTVSVRINSLDPQYWYRDLKDLLENCSERLDNLIILKAGCAADFAASMDMITTGIGSTQEEYYMHHAGQKCWSNPRHWARASLVAACRTNGMLPVDGPYGDFNVSEMFLLRRTEPRL